MSLVLRVVVYSLVVFLVVVVHTAQRHTDARSTLHAAVGVAGKWLWKTAVGVGLMLLLGWLFIG